MASDVNPSSGSARADEQMTESLPLERRSSEREPVEGFALLNVTEPGAPGRLCPVELVDASAGGLGALSTDPIEPGRVFELYRHGTEAPRVVGTVARCARAGGGRYRLGLRFATARAA